MTNDSDESQAFTRDSSPTTAMVVDELQLQKGTNKIYFSKVKLPKQCFLPELKKVLDKR